MVREINLTSDERRAIINIVRGQNPEYETVTITSDNIIHAYKNYEPCQSWSDYNSNYDDHFKIHWFEYMITQTDVNSSYDEEYSTMIFLDGVCPLDAYRIIKEKEEKEKKN